MITYSHTIVKRGQAPKDVFTAEQIHSDIANLATCSNDKKIVGDAVVTEKNGLKIGVFTSDCVPVIYFDENNKIVGVSHNGWRGTINKLAENTLNLMVGLGARKNTIKCILGPSIGDCCYNIYGDRLKLFEKLFNNHKDKIFKNKKKQTFLNLKECTRIRLLEAGVSEENIITDSHCTCCNTMYPSYKAKRNTDHSILTWVTMT